MLEVLEAAVDLLEILLVLGELEDLGLQLGNDQIFLVARHLAGVGARAAVERGDELWD